MSSNKADITLVVGASGSGKGVYAKARLAKWRGPAVVWDAKREYGLDGTESAADFLRQLGTLTGRGRVAFYPSPSLKVARKQFDLVSEAVYRRGTVLFIAEELGDVVDATWAPDGWRRVVTQGRHAGLSVIAIVQRPAGIDKTTVDNATVVRGGRLNSPAGRKYMANLLDVPVDQVADLKPLEWIERDMQTGKVRRETLRPS